MYTLSQTLIKNGFRGNPEVAASYKEGKGMQARDKHKAALHHILISMKDVA